MERLNALAFFPLGLFKLPGELLDLHIFEPRYRQLIAELVRGEIDFFGIPSLLVGDIVGSNGCLVRLNKVYKTYPDGRYDIQVEVIGIFDVLDYQEIHIGKLYSAGDVQLLDLEELPLGTQTLAALEELITSFPQVFQTSHLELKDFSLLSALPFPDVIKLLFIKVEDDNEARDVFLSYQLQLMGKVLAQDKAVSGLLCLN